MEVIRAKRDFIFIDESGEPGAETAYYIQGLIHVTDASLKNLNIHLGALRYFGNIRKELKSTQLNPFQKEHLLTVLKLAVDNGDFIRISAVYVNKENYKGNYLKNKSGFPRDPTRFRHFILRRLLEFHFKKVVPQSREIELIVDRFQRSESRERQMKAYLKSSRFYNLSEYLYITFADSRYTEMLQIADWISGSVKENYFTHKERNFEDLFLFIKTKQVRQ